MSTQESQLQCIDAVKNRCRLSSTKSLEAISIDHKQMGRKKSIKESKNKLYEIEIMEEDGANVKVHYSGYASIYDEWKPKHEVVLMKPDYSDSVESEWSPLTELACSIKKRLLPSRSEDPEIRIQVPCDHASFQLLQSKAVPIRGCTRGQGSYTINTHKDLNDLLGPRWYIRIVNPVGDFSYVILKTIRFSLTRGRPILEYEVLRKDDKLDFTPVYIEQSHYLIFTFVRGDGNKKDLLNFI